MFICRLICKVFVLKLVVTLVFFFFFFLRSIRSKNFIKFVDIMLGFFCLFLHGHCQLSED